MITLIAFAIIVAACAFALYMALTQLFEDEDKGDRRGKADNRKA